MKKNEELERWRSLSSDVNPLDHMKPIPYKTKGSRYGCCGVRIDGSPKFVDAVLGRLKGIIGGENNETRLELSRRKVEPVEIGDLYRGFENAPLDAEVCYIRLHERGNEAKIVNSILNRRR